MNQARVVVSDDENMTEFYIPGDLVPLLLGGSRQVRKELKRNIGEMVSLCVQRLAVAVKGGDEDAGTPKEAEDEEGQAIREEVTR